MPALTVPPASPAMLTVAVVGVPRVTPLVGLDNVTVKVLVPVNGVALLTGTTMFCGDESFAAQLSVPDVDV